MSRLEVESKILIKIFQVFSNKYKTIISRKDLSFYKRKYEDGNNDLGNFEYVINKYTGDDYKKLNDYLREDVVRGFTENELKSWAYCLHSSLCFNSSNVDEGSVVYRGISRPVPNDWKVGKKFYFGEFISTSYNLSIAKRFAGVNGYHYY